jgi:hypothetical protein
MNRRRFTFWLGFGLFSLSEKLSLSGLDGLAAAAMRRTDKVKAATARTGGEHWAVGGNKEWRWFERENLVKGEWVLTGTTTPINKHSGDRKPENIAYIDDILVPAEVLASDKDAINLVNHEVAVKNDAAKDVVAHANLEHTDGDQPEHEHVVDLDPQLPTAEVRARHGRPPSKWLRSLHADEIRIWLKTVRLPEAEVSGMTVWTHLTRDHLFAADHIKGLTEDEQNQLHAAAHFGY